MSKYYGVLGFTHRKETKPGIYTDCVTERECYGDIIECRRRFQETESVNDNIRINDKMSVLLDPYIEANIFALSYATYMGAKWKVESTDIQRPRLILTLGGLYHEKTKQSP